MSPLYLRVAEGMVYDSYHSLSKEAIAIDIPGYERTFSVSILKDSGALELRLDSICKHPLLTAIVGERGQFSFSAKIEMPRADVKYFDAFDHLSEAIYRHVESFLEHFRQGLLQGAKSNDTEPGNQEAQK